MQSSRMNHSHYFSDFKEDMLYSSKRKSSALADHYASKGSSINEGTQLLGNLFNAAEVDMASEFQRRFTFGLEMTIWRKQKKKSCVFFIDQQMPSFIWISTHSKAFLFDLSFTTIQRFDFALEQQSKLKHYFILRYFQQELPIVFQGADAARQAHTYYDLFHNYIVYNRIMGDYPSFFSKILKKSIIEDIKDDIVRSRKAADVLKVSDDITWNFKEFNEDVMKFIISQKANGSSMETSLTHEEINSYFKISCCCEQIREVFQKYAGVKFVSFYDYLKPTMSKQAFLDFLVTEQDESREVLEEVKEVGQDLMSFYDFSLYVLNQKNNSAAAAGLVNQSYPLSDYFCYSSHNTYLSGNQLTSDCKIDRYLQDLDNGLKCVQLDVHNDGNVPIITHGFKDQSFCKPIDFQETLQAISGFCRQNQNHYPIILSIENHASETNRYRMLNIITKIFGQKLLLVGNDLQLHQLATFKTLGQLKGKIIVKSDSKIKELCNQSNNFNQNNANNNPEGMQPNNQYDFNFRQAMPRGQFPTANFSNQYNQFQEMGSEYNIRKQEFSNNLQKELYLPLQEMTKVTGLFKSPTGIDNPESTAYECTSLTNEKAMKANQDFILNYTRRSWLRIYPAATEISSGNYNPVPLLRIGAQIIALNTQTKDDNVLTQMSYFTAGRELNPSKIGYILKPAHLIKGSQLNRERVTKTIQVRVISNEQIKIRLFGSDQDMKANSSSNLSFTVRDYLQGFLIFKIGSNYKDCIPLRFLRQGYRVLVAKNQFFRDSGKRILIHASIKEVGN